MAIDLEMAPFYKQIKSFPLPDQMSYKVIARRWRPRSFEDVVGQAHVVTTLKNSIRREG